MAEVEWPGDFHSEFSPGWGGDGDWDCRVLAVAASSPGMRLKSSLGSLAILPFLGGPVLRISGSEGGGWTGRVSGWGASGWLLIGGGGVSFLP